MHTHVKAGFVLTRPPPPPSPPRSFARPGAPRQSTTAMTTTTKITTTTKTAYREVVWDSYDRAVASSKARVKLKAARDLELASDDDAKSKADAWILTKQVGGTQNELMK